MITCIGKVSGKIGIAWKEELEPLCRPDDRYPMTSTEHIRLLHERCDALLRRLEEHEKVMLDLMKVR